MTQASPSKLETTKIRLNVFSDYNETKLEFRNNDNDEREINVQNFKTREQFLNNSQEDGDQRKGAKMKSADNLEDRSWPSSNSELMYDVRNSLTTYLLTG